MTKQPTTCKRCGATMRVTTAFRLPIDDTLQVQPALECVKCGMLYAGGEWSDMRAEPYDEWDEDDEDDPDDLIEDDDYVYPEAQ